MSVGLVIGNAAALFDPEPVIYDYQVDRLPSPKAAMRLSGSSSDPADD